MAPVALIFMLVGLLGWSSADPFEGKWMLNAAKSQGTVPKEETVLIRRQNGTLTVQVSIVNADAANSTFVIRYAVPVKGGIGRVEGGPYSGVSIKRMNARTLDTTYLANGAPVRSTRAVVAKDGKSITSTGKAIGAGEQPAWVMVFEKQ
jgi:hypothetical protein